MLFSAGKPQTLARMLVIAFLGSVPACTLPRTREPVTIVQSRSIVFDAAQTAKFMWALGHCSGPPVDSISGTWTPASVDARFLHGRLFNSLRASLGPNAHARPEEYYFQYFGVISRGRRVILVNGFHESVRRGGTERPDDWTREPLVVCDTGIGSFQATYDVEARRLGELRFFSTFNGAH
jgi:hypothetical protein